MWLCACWGVCKNNLRGRERERERERERKRATERERVREKERERESWACVRAEMFGRKI